MGMVLPYLLKVREDPDVTFDISYFYTLVATALFGAVALIPVEITPSPQFWVALFMSAFGTQTLFSKAKTEKPIVLVANSPEGPPTQ